MDALDKMTLGYLLYIQKRYDGQFKDLLRVGLELNNNHRVIVKYQHQPIIP